MTPLLTAFEVAATVAVLLVMLAHQLVAARSDTGQAGRRWTALSAVTVVAFAVAVAIRLSSAL
ncbi:MAG: hypothetical protein QOJ79_607 [Actinomycetota bacterium]|jgi:hypothetical protein|nr:hypothetical protein [Actinomycetota bacterium]